MSNQRGTALIDLLGSGASVSVPLRLPVTPGHCTRIHLVRYMVAAFRESVPTKVQSLYSLSPNLELADEALPSNNDEWIRESRFWLTWNQMLHIGSTSDEAMVQLTYDLPIPGGLDFVGDLRFCVLNVNWESLVNYRCEVIYEVIPVDATVRRQLRARAQLHT